MQVGKGEEAKLYLQKIRFSFLENAKGSTEEFLKLIVSLARPQYTKKVISPYMPAMNNWNFKLENPYHV